MRPASTSVGRAHVDELSAAVAHELGGAAGLMSSFALISADVNDGASALTAG